MSGRRPLGKWKVDDFGLLARCGHVCGLLVQPFDGRWCLPGFAWPDLVPITVAHFKSADSLAGSPGRLRLALSSHHLLLSPRQSVSGGVRRFFPALTRSCRLSLGHCGLVMSGVVGPALSDQRPGDAGELVGERHTLPARMDLVLSSLHPPPTTGAHRGCPSSRCRAIWAWPAGGVLGWNQAEARRKSPRAGIAFSRGIETGQQRSNEAANAGNGGKP